DAVAAGTAPPTLRFYEWALPCLSLGYFQSFDVVDVDGCRALGVDVVRRPTGGRAILHDRELTYSVALPAAVLGQDGGVLPSYYRLSLALQDGLRRLGVPATLAPESAGSSAAHGPVCFDRPSAHEILLHGRKPVGRAQLRRGVGPGPIEVSVSPLDAAPGAGHCLETQQGPDEEGHCSGDGRTAAGIWPLLARGFGYTLYVVPGAVCTTAHWTCQALFHVRAKLHCAYAGYVP